MDQKPNQTAKDKNIAAEAEEGSHDEDKKRRLASCSRKAAAAGGGGGGGGLSCQAENCAADLSEARRYHRRHKVCELHAKAPAVLVAGLIQRFCQQCSRFHELSEFDDTKRSCRRRLAGHNERRRKSSSECRHAGQGSGSGSSVTDMQISSLNGNTPTGYKHFQIR